MKTLASVIGAGLIASVLGCADASKEIAVLADQMCACPDKACADKVVDDFASFLAANHKTFRGDPNQVQEATGKLTKCAVEKGVDPRILLEKTAAATK